jgi:Uncharacterized protein conserved in bacteria (DUF2252)
MPELLPLRHGRMVKSAFTFYRGAALTMAADLATTAATGIRVQCCGDAHLCNFGGFATPERRIIFSINDLDETLPAPWEWDLKRLAASFAVACRDHGLSEAVGKDTVMICVRSYREAMAELSQLKALELWYRSLSAEELLEGLPTKWRKRLIKRIEKEQAKSRGEEMFPNHGQRVVDGYRRMQPASDMFLGWGHGPKRDFFVRQLRDMQISPMVETFRQFEMDSYAGWCGRALALSHARSGNAAMLSGYMGKSDVLDKALAAFAVACADQNEKDHAALDKAVRKGTVKAVFEAEE